MVSVFLDINKLIPMTKRILRISLLFVLFLSTRVTGQHLTISGIGGTFLDVLNDTAFEAIPNYVFSATVMNIDSSANTYSDTIAIYLKANSKPVDVVYPGTFLDSLPPFVPIVKTNPQYHFTPNHFDDGDNIVVIWPQAISTPVQTDTFTTQIFFISLINVDEFESASLKVYPNPATEYLLLEGLSKISLKHVRIQDMQGRLKYEGIPSSDMISVKELSPGTYTITLERTDGKRKVLTMIKQ